VRVFTVRAGRLASSVREAQDQEFGWRRLVPRSRTGLWDGLYSDGVRAVLEDGAGKAKVANGLGWGLVPHSGGLCRIQGELTPPSYNLEVDS